MHEVIKSHRKFVWNGVTRCEVQKQKSDLNSSR